MEGDDISEPQGGVDELEAGLDCPGDLLAGGQPGVDLHQVHGLQASRLVEQGAHRHTLSRAQRLSQNTNSRVRLYLTLISLTNQKLCYSDWSLDIC